MQVVYTYKKPEYKYLEQFDQHQWLLKSARSAKEVGYDTVLYTDDENVVNEYIDEYKIVSDSSFVWDSFKYIALKEHTGDFFLSDNDVIYTKQIPFSGSDIEFNGFEESWKGSYKSTVKYITAHKLFDDFYFWNSKPTKVINTGILKFGDVKLKAVYLDYWKQAEQKLTPYLSELDPIFATCVVTQLILTKIVERRKSLYDFFTVDDLHSSNEYYNRFVGNEKGRKKHMI